MFKINFSIAEIIAILSAFNCMTVAAYLKFCWNLVNGLLTLNTLDRLVTVLHVCLAHFTKRVRDTCLQLFKCGTEVILYCVSLCRAVTEHRRIIL
jgi:hypothetical protein